MADEALTAGAVARRLGVAVTTLRTWHQRYGLGPSHHLPGQHRRYTPEDMDRLQVMRRLTAQGVAPAEAAAWARRIPLPTDVPTAVSRVSPAHPEQGTDRPPASSPSANTEAQQARVEREGTPGPPTQDRRTGPAPSGGGRDRTATARGDSPAAGGRPGQRLPADAPLTSQRAGSRRHDPDAPRPTPSGSGPATESSDPAYPGDLLGADDGPALPPAAVRPAGRQGLAAQRPGRAGVGWPLDPAWLDVDPSSLAEPQDALDAPGAGSSPGAAVPTAPIDEPPATFSRVGTAPPAVDAVWPEQNGRMFVARDGGVHAIRTGRAGPAARGLARAAMRLDGPALRDILEMTVTNRGVVAAWEEVIMPVLIGVGERYAATNRFIEVEHILSRGVTEVLGSVTRPPSSQIPRVLLAAADDEQHTLPLEALAAALAQAGVSSRLLGARVPAQAVADAIARTGPTVLVLWSQLPGSADPAQWELVLSSRHRPLLVAAAGPGWRADRLPDGVTLLGSLGEAVHLVSAIALPTDQTR